MEMSAIAVGRKGWFVKSSLLVAFPLTRSLQITKLGQLLKYHSTQQCTLFSVTNGHKNLVGLLKSLLSGSDKHARSVPHCQALGYEGGKE